VVIQGDLTRNLPHSNIDALRFKLCQPRHLTSLLQISADEGNRLFCSNCSLFSTFTNKAVVSLSFLYW
jgi:hypothetical protein